MHEMLVVSVPIRERSVAWVLHGRFTFGMLIFGDSNRVS